MSEYIYRRERVSWGWSAKNTGEEIVRCRDCTHFMTWTNGYSFCSAFSIGATGEPFPGEPDGFCAWAVKRKESSE